MPSSRATFGEAGSVIDLLAGAGLQELAVGDDDDLVGQQGGLLGIVGDEHGRQAGVSLEAAQLPTQFLADGRVEGRRTARRAAPAAGCG